MRLRAEDSLAPAVKGTLVDVSPSGFRARHDSFNLRSGETVHFEHSGLTGRARIMWTLIVGDAVEAGFLILSKSPAN